MDIFYWYILNIDLSDLIKYAFVESKFIDHNV